jgi:hypothetical protein
MTNYQYRSEIINPVTAVGVERLNQLGKEGWDIFQFIPYGGEMLAVMKKMAWSQSSTGTTTWIWNTGSLLNG